MEKILRKSTGDIITVLLIQAGYPMCFHFYMGFAQMSNLFYGFRMQIFLHTLKVLAQVLSHKYKIGCKKIIMRISAEIMLMERIKFLSDLKHTLFRLRILAF